MTDLRLSFSSETLLRLTSDQFNQLSIMGETIIEFAPAKHKLISEEALWLSLSFDSSLCNYFFEFKPQEDIDKFVKNSYLTHFFPKTGKIKLIKDSEKSLSDILLENRIKLTNQLSIDKSKFNEQQTTFLDLLNTSSVDKLVKTGNFKGQISCCECENPGCSSEYLWAEENFGLASFHILAAGLILVNLYPFKLV